MSSKKNTCIPGHVDPSFGENGFAEIGTEKQCSTDANGVACTPEGKLLAVWSKSLTTGNKAGLARFNADGTLDKQYGEQGLAAGSFKERHRSVPQGMALLSDGRAVMYGNYLIHVEPAFKPIPSVLCFTEDGKVDAHFASGGVYSLPELPAEEKYGMATSACVLPDNAVLILYSKTINSISTSYILKLTAKGVVDITFGTNGTCEFTLKGESTEAGGILALNNDRFAIFNSFASPQSFIACFDKQGSLVRDFGIMGIVTLSYADKRYTQLNLTETASGFVSVGIVVLGTNLYRGLITGLTHAGQIDVQFNQGEPVIVTHPTSGDGLANCHQILVQPDNKLVISGYRPLASPEPAGYIGRYLADGKPDEDFGENGLAGTDALVLTAAQKGITSLSTPGRLILAGAYEKRGTLAAFYG